ncbi:hypothetical protein [Erwinia sp. QL-Z3]|uniref:hypothetical protein n=1 Tax=Erwinia sp. QL-Z3 TaxID=2547962 RepID=UPI0010709828|nr:hypothetical protein [Erwinia sp. QL-Z3]QBR48523.1 hypothetical protein E2F51_00310 [Erwinia sp. QL-Z3]
MSRRTLGADTTTTTVYIGHARYKELEKLAIEVTGLTGFPVKPSAVVHFIIDEMAQRVIDEMHKRTEENRMAGKSVS